LTTVFELSSKFLAENRKFLDTTGNNAEIEK
jgi:hypothetical protein